MEKPGASTWAPGLPGPAAPRAAVLSTPEGLHKLPARARKAERTPCKTPQPLRSVCPPGGRKAGPRRFGLGAQGSAERTTRSLPRAPARLSQLRAAPGEAGDSENREDPSCSRPPQLRSRRRGSVLPPGPGQPIKQNTNVTIFFLLIASPDISARWEEKKKDEEVRAGRKEEPGRSGRRLREPGAGCAPQGAFFSY